MLVCTGYERRIHTVKQNLIRREFEKNRMWQGWTEGEYVTGRETDMQRKKERKKERERESREKGKETERIEEE